MPGKTLIYVGAEADGLYRKEESDGQWQKLAKGMPPSPQVRAISIHPNNSKVIFVGTQRGVYRTLDGGDNFERMNMSEGRHVWAIKFHPDDPDTMFLGTEGSEVFKSTDGGENWDHLATIVNQDSVQMALLLAFSDWISNLLILIICMLRWKLAEQLIALTVESHGQS